MKKGIMIAVVVAMFGWAVYDLAGKTDTEKEQAGEQTAGNEAVETPDVPVGLEIGNLAPDFELQTIHGKTTKLSDFRGKRVMINFWATWCPPCRAEMPDMQKFYENHDVEILAVNLTQTEAARSDVGKFKENFGLTFPILMDEELKVATTYQIRPIPTSYMIDSQGIVQFEALGALNYELMVDQFKKMN